MDFTLKQQPGYNKPLSKRTNLAGPKMFVITEFDCTSKMQKKKFCEFPMSEKNNVKNL
jgi:hypothetical protein